jgi:hypothetical protein
MTDLEDVRRIDPVVGPPAHHMIALHIAFVHRHLEKMSVMRRGCAGMCRLRTLLYVAE